MDNGALAVLESWQIRPVLMTAAALACIVYIRGFLKLRRQMAARFPTWRLAAFIGGQATLIVAVASPLDAFSSLLLQVHMIQHLMLMLIAPPLILMGAPAIPMLRGLPASFAQQSLGPFLKWPALRRFWNWLVHPVTAFVAFSVATWTWHIPAPYQFALRSPGWHQVEHICFFVSALLFWFPVVQPWPAKSVWPRWAMVPYLLLADVQNMFLSVVLTFSERLIYPIYGAVPRLDGISAINDQVAAGAIMWVPGSMFFLVPAIGIAASMLSPNLVGWNAAPVRISKVAERSAPRDFLRIPAIGAIVRSLYFRRIVQTIVLIVAAAVIIDGFRGPGASPLNLAGVLPWIYWRGLLVIGLMAVGNLFCFACPFTLARDLVRRVVRVDLAWPRRLRTKWVAIALLGLFFCAYEVFGLWDSPRMTASLIAGYFAAAIAIDVLFSGATFCKYLCPIGQFQFIQSAISPLEVRARKASICASCTTHDCLRGNESSRGCELELFMPRKAGNLDCTLCLDCVRACPHDNIGLFGVAPGADLIGDPVRSSIGRMSRRPDIVALAMIVVFGGFAGAAAMVAPVADWETWLGRVIGIDAPRLTVVAFFALTLTVIPIAFYMLAVAVDRIVTRRVTPGVANRDNWREISRRFAYALIPLGFAMWTAHLMFHLLTGLDSIGGVLSRVPFVEGSGWQPSFSWSAGSASLLNLELLILDVGLLLTLYVAWRIARTIAGRLRAAAALVAPWAAIAIVLYLTGVWTMVQPMPMRGTMNMMPGMPMPMPVKMSMSTSTVMTTVVRPVSMMEGR